jgi:hypothetical protein
MNTTIYLKAYIKLWAALEYTPDSTSLIHVHYQHQLNQHGRFQNSELRCSCHWVSHINAMIANIL